MWWRGILQSRALEDGFDRCIEQSIRAMLAGTIRLPSLQKHDKNSASSKKADTSSRLRLQDGTVPRASETKTKKVKKTCIRRATRIVIVSITADPDCRISYAQALILAKSKIDLADITVIKIEIFHDSHYPRDLWNQEDCQSGYLGRTSQGGPQKKKIKITHLTKKAKFHLHSLDDSITITEVVAALARNDKCLE